ncbi:MFS general substrate transporter [Delitschia confertaspora ATCC 74209]|uniref:MFS general substrate transporter n=1 Tax=Delitschia confertaspora ATCC 74209 TaxID=1513339 RepID=A0A9P4MRE3_9PLEO|nr:MFS general substrate transporter [Delitschia confertaspora ATCC 74209]
MSARDSQEGVRADAISTDEEKAETSIGSDSVNEKQRGQHQHDGPFEPHDGPLGDDLGDELERHLSRKSIRRGNLTAEKYPLMDLDNGLVGWESQEDPLNPRNLPDGRKWTLLGFVAAISFLSPLASSICAPTVPFINEAFGNTSSILSSFVVSVFVLGFAFGPLFLSPLSEIFGRSIVLNISNVLFVAMNLGCALTPNFEGLIIMRFFSGIGGSACQTIGSGVIADLFLAEQRGLATAMYGMGILFGPTLGPILGGFIAQRAGWRWDFWVVFIASAVVTALLFVLNKETNPVVLIEAKTQRLRKELNRPDLQNAYTHQKDASTLRRRNILQQGLIRPLKLLFTSPIVFLLSLYISFVFGLLYLLFTTITTVYINTYGWDPEMCGLAFLGIGIGNFAGMIFVGKYSDATIIRLSKRNGNVYEPEMRLPTCLYFGCLVPISFFWYGWATKGHTHWIVPIIGLLPFGAGIMGIFTPIQTYLIDAFPMYAASAVAALTALRCLFGAVLPLAAPSMYEELGLGWGNSLLGFIAIAMIPFPALIYRYGGYIRKRWPVKL